MTGFELEYEGVVILATNLILFKTLTLKIAEPDPKWQFVGVKHNFRIIRRAGGGMVLYNPIQTSDFDGNRANGRTKSGVEYYRSRVVQGRYVQDRSGRGETSERDRDTGRSRRSRKRPLQNAHGHNP
jgi:hypothetical protein